jgi:hypothetical protein
MDYVLGAERKPLAIAVEPATSSIAALLLRFARAEEPVAGLPSLSAAAPLLPTLSDSAAKVSSIDLSAAVGGEIRRVRAMLGRSPPHYNMCLSAYCAFRLLFLLV